METGNYEAWVGRDAYDRNGDKIGQVEAIYYDDLTSRPEWVAVRTGLFGKKVTFAPIAGSSARAEDLELAYDKDLVKDAPNCEADGHLSEDEERRLFEHYQFSWDDTGDQRLRRCGPGGHRVRQTGGDAMPIERRTTR